MSKFHHDKQQGLLIKRLLSVQATKLKHQLTYEQRRDLKADVAAAKAEVKKIQENLEKLEAEAQTAAEAAESVEQELAAEVRSDPQSPSPSCFAPMLTLPTRG